MTTAPEPDITPTDEPGLPENIELVPTGWIHVRTGGQTYRLRRPLLGELRKLRTALEDVTDDIGAKSNEVEALALELTQAAAEAAQSSEPLSAARRRSLDSKRTKSRKVGRELVDFADDARLGWWRLVFETLGVGDGSGGDKVPADWPSWVVDANLPGKVTQHWRTAPLAPGR